MTRTCMTTAPCSSACKGPGSAVNPSFWAAETSAGPAACAAGLMTGALAARLTMTVASSSSSCCGKAPAAEASGCAVLTCTAL